MKKFFIFIFVLTMATVSAFAQSLTLSYEGAPVNNGETIEVVVPELNVNADYYLDVTNVSDQDILVRVYKDDLDMVDGASASLCFGGSCYPPSTSQSSTVLIAAHSTLSHSSPDAFHLSYKTLSAGTSFVQFTFSNDDNSDDNTVVIFKLVCNPTGIASNAVATSMRAYPNPASENVTIEYAYTGYSSNVNLVIKNLLGSIIYSRILDANDNKVRVDVSDYNAGIYFYSIEADGRPLVTKKLLVK